MVTEFDLVFEDFEAELNAVEGMIASLATTGESTTSARARVAGANAATLLLASTFEEFVRQEVRAVFTTRSAGAADINVFPRKIAGAVWRRSLERLAKVALEDLERDTTALDERIKATVDFCIGKDVKADVSDAVAHNDNNMRPGELNRLFNQLGISNMCGRAAGYDPLMVHLGRDTPGTALTQLETRLEKFFRRRNEIAHAIQLNSSSGPPSLSSDIALFREFGRALAVECARFCGTTSNFQISDAAQHQTVDVTAQQASSDSPLLVPEEENTIPEEAPVGTHPQD